MSAKARARMNAGVQKPRQDQQPKGAPRSGLKLPTSRKAVLAGKLARCQDWERDGIREYLRKDGSPLALSVLGELEETWKS